MILSSSSSSPFSLLFSSALLPSSPILLLQFPEKGTLFTVFLILSLLCSGTLAQQNPTNLGFVSTELNSGIAAQLPGIIGQNLGTAAQIPGTVAQNIDSVAQQQQEQQLQQCPGNTFRCGDGSCIPQDWVGDGDADCHDLSDEKSRPTTLFINPSSSTTLTKGTRRLSTAEEPFEDPFDQIATVAPNGKQLSVSVSPLLRTDAQTGATKPPPSGFLRRISDVHGCLNIVQTRLEQCSADLTSWVQNLDLIDLTNSSMLNDETRWRELDHGCELLLEFRTCTETLNISACILPRSIQLWNNIELYVCQLLLPSIKEYKSCFANVRHPQCVAADAVSSNVPSVCRILTSVGSDLRCVQQNAQNGCTANALEVIGPLESETDHMYTQLACAYLAGATGLAPGSAFASSTFATLAESRDERVPCCNDVFQTFSVIDQICAQAVSPQWTGVQRAVCANRDKLVLQRQCFINASTLVHCSQKPGNDTVCSALEQFSNNIDCALRVMNDICTIEAQNVVVTVQDTLNDDLIANRCYVDTISNASSADNQEFKLNPTNIRCSSEQENLALACLVELVEVNRKVAELQSLNFLHEISESNSSLVSGICELYQKYNSCINNTVFVHSGGQRCAFNSPLNTLARVGLSPICSERTRTLLQKNSECIRKIEHRTSVCQSGLSSLGPAIHSMLQGIHGEAHLCNSYFLIRDAFECGKKIVAEACSTEAVLDLQHIQQLLIDLGIEEGCPTERPNNLQEIIARPVAAPTARPLPKISSGRSESVPVLTCDPEEQKRFAACIQPITAFQPHPLAVIKQPKQIDEACKQFNEYKKCQANVSCFPLWAKGMSAMFEFACGPAYNTYVQVRQCVRKATTREDIRECVGEFSRGAPQLACQSSNKLLACAAGIIGEKCGQLGAQFVTDYIDKFAKAIDSTCKIGTQQNDKAIIGHNCTAEQTALIDHCAAPINELTSRIDELFEGGLQQFLANVKNLAPVFAQGCNLTSEFRHCLRPLLEQDTEQCVVSSCLIRAGDGICDQPDTAQAIDDNLACIFKQASEPEFGKCLRSTIATLKQFNLAALRSVLPQFVNCVEHIVVQRCGQTPVNVLRAISTTEMCPIRAQSEPSSSLVVPKICSTEVQQKHADCVGDFYREHRMLPIALLSNPTAIDALCVEMSKLSSCSYPACEENRHRALKALAEYICIRRDAYKRHSACLTSVATSPQGSQCLAAFLTTAPERHCLSLTNAANCAAQHVNDACGYEALTLSFEGMHAFAKELNDSCSIQIPVAAIKTTCSESGIVDYLQCENLIDHFSFTPLSFIRNSSEWIDFCEAVNGYEGCLANASCRVEPVSSANTALFSTICGEEEESTRTFLPCLTQFLNTDSGKSCSQPFAALDLLAKDIPQTVCSSVETMLLCAASELSAQCTEQALRHVIKMLSIWVRKFDPYCSLSGLGGMKEVKPGEELLLDSSPTQVAVDQAVSPSSPTVIPRIPLIVTASSIPEPEPNPVLEPAPGLSTSSDSPLVTVSARGNADDVVASTAEPEPEPAPSPGMESIFTPSLREDLSVTSSAPEPAPESADTQSKATDGDSAAQPSPEPSPEPETDVTNLTVNKTRTQGTGCTISSDLWLLSLAALAATLFVQQ